MINIAFACEFLIFKNDQNGGEKLWNLKDYLMSAEFHAKKSHILIEASFVPSISAASS